MPVGYSVNAAFSGATAAQVYTNSLVSGSDVRVVYWNGTAWIELDRDLVLFSASNISVWFKSQAAIPASCSAPNSYYLYYKNAGASSPPTDKAAVYLFWDDFSPYSMGDSGAPTWTVPGITGAAVVSNTGSSLTGPYYRQYGLTNSSGQGGFV